MSPVALPFVPPRLRGAAGMGYCEGRSHPLGLVGVFHHAHAFSLLFLIASRVCQCVCLGC